MMDEMDDKTRAPWYSGALTGMTFPAVEDDVAPYPVWLFLDDVEGLGSPAWIRAWDCFADRKRMFRHTKPDQPASARDGLHGRRDRAGLYLGVCAVCGDVLPVKVSAGRPQRYCSTRHENMVRVARRRFRFPDEVKVPTVKAPPEVDEPYVKPEPQPWFTQKFGVPARSALLKTADILEDIAPDLVEQIRLHEQGEPVLTEASVKAWAARPRRREPDQLVRSWLHYNEPLYPARNGRIMRQRHLQPGWDKVSVAWRVVPRQVVYRVDNPQPHVWRMAC